MTLYLVYAIIYNCIVKEFPMKRDIDISQEPIPFLYPKLWKHKAPFHIYHIHDSFMGRCREIMMGEVPNRINREARDFPNGKGQFFIEDEHISFRLFGFEGTPFFLRKFCH